VLPPKNSGTPYPDFFWPGLILWHPRGATLQFELRRFIEDEILRRGYDLVYTPHVTREALFVRSGHLPMYEGVQFPPMAGYRITGLFGKKIRLGHGDLLPKPALPKLKENQVVIAPPVHILV